jgi:hypothetical protein
VAYTLTLTHILCVTAYDGISMIYNGHSRIPMDNYCLDCGQGGKYWYLVNPSRNRRPSRITSLPILEDPIEDDNVSDLLEDPVFYYSVSSTLISLMYSYVLHAANTHVLVYFSFE